MTAGQREVLGRLTDGPLTATVIASQLKHGTYDAVHSSLRRLEDRGLVRRVFPPAPNPAAHWELTHAGRSALQLTT